MSSRVSNAIYISSFNGKVFEFNYGHNYKNVNSKDQFMEFVEEFNNYVFELGKKNEFPKEIIEKMNEIEMDMLLIDVQANPRSTFFICTPSDDKFVDIMENNEYKMVGNNGFKTLFYSKKGEIYDVVDTKKASQIYIRIANA